MAVAQTGAAILSAPNEPQVRRHPPPRWMHDVVLQFRQGQRREVRAKLIVPGDANPAAAYRRWVAVCAPSFARAGTAERSPLRLHGRHGAHALTRHSPPATSCHSPPPAALDDRYSNTGYRDWRSSSTGGVRAARPPHCGKRGRCGPPRGFFGSWVGTGAYVSIEFVRAPSIGVCYALVAYMTALHSCFVHVRFVRIAGGGEEGSCWRAPIGGRGRSWSWPQHRRRGGGR